MATSYSLLFKTANKQFMKLYTEEQVIALTKSAFTAGQNHNSFIFEAKLKDITPIELSSDEEIKKQAFKLHEHSYFEFNSYIDGAQWMRDKIQGGNK